MSEQNLPEEQARQKKPESVNSTIPAGRNQALVSVIAKVVMVLAVSLSLYQLYTAGIAALTALIQRSLHLGAILSLTFSM